MTFDDDDISNAGPLFDPSSHKQIDLEDYLKTSSSTGKIHNDRQSEIVRWSDMSIDVDWLEDEGVFHILIMSIEGKPLPDPYTEFRSYFNRSPLAQDVELAGGPVKYAMGLLDRLAIGNTAWAALINPSEQTELFA